MLLDKAETLKHRAVQAMHQDSRLLLPFLTYITKLVPILIVSAVPSESDTPE